MLLAGCKRANEATVGMHVDNTYICSRTGSNSKEYFVAEKTFKAQQSW
jgi:hypothetical protein